MAELPEVCAALADLGAPQPEYEHPVMRVKRLVLDTEFPLFRCARTRPLPAGFVFLATAMIVDADRSGRQLVRSDQPSEAAAQDGSRPMNPISWSCGPASGGTGTRAPYCPDDRSISSIGSIPASRSAQSCGSSRSS